MGRLGRCCKGAGTEGGRNGDAALFEAALGPTEGISGRQWLDRRRDDAHLVR